MTKAQRSLALLIGFAVIGGAVALFAYQRAADDAAGRSTDKTADAIFSFMAESVVSVTAREGDVETVIERRPHGWWVIQPETMRADEGMMNNLIQTMKSLKPKVRFGVAGAPEAPTDDVSGLDKPSQSLALTLDNGKTLLLEVGVKSPFDGAHYARATTETGKVFRITVSGGLTQRVAARWDKMRDLRILAAEPTRIVRIKVSPKNPNPNAIAFEVKAEVPDMSLPAFRRKIRFKMVSPAAGGASVEAIKQVFHTLGKSRMAQLYAVDGREKAEALGFSDPLFLIEVDAMSLASAQANKVPPKARVIRLVPHPDEPGAMLVMRDGENLIASVSREVEVGLKQTVASLVSKQIVDLDREAVDRVEITLPRGGPHMIFERRDLAEFDDPVWQMLAPEPTRARTAKIATVLVLFAELEGIKQTAAGAKSKSAELLKKTGLDTPIKIKMSEGANDRTTTLLIGQPEGASVGYGMAEGGDVIVEVPLTKVNAIPRSVVEIRDTL